jgi:hypothetical protein
MNLNELIEIEKSLRDFQNKALSDYELMIKLKPEIAAASRSLGILSYTIEKLTKETEISIDSL